jgi:hypothetical protein
LKSRKISLRIQEIQTAFWWRNLFETCHLEDRKGDERITLRWILEMGVMGKGGI